MTDGGTIRCGSERIRLLGIDAPELHGCPRNRTCAPGSGSASKASLQRLIRGDLRIERVGKDRYGRTLAQVYAGGRNVACEQLRQGGAIYKPNWDNGRRLAKECPQARY
ncbi:MAG: thermonuclease family protein [Sphingobium sp.]